MQNTHEPELSLRRGSAPRQIQFLRTAVTLARQICSEAIPVADGSLVWRKRRSVTPELLGPHLYDGTAGIAMFLAALERVTGTGEYRETSLRAITPLRHKLAALGSDPERAARVRLGIGGVTGLGSFLYSFIRIGQWLEEPALIEEAAHLTVLLTQERISVDDNLDIALGAAGAVLALLALDRLMIESAGTRSSALEISLTCALHLLQRRSPENGTPRAWPCSGSPEHPCLTGFAHGAAGICNALLKLYERTQREELWDAAQEGLAFERSLYSPEHRNWQDVRSSPLRFMTSWCHGAPGIALGRLGTLSIDDCQQVRHEIDQALQTTMALGLTDLDNICCGNFGHVDILLYAYQKLGDESHLEAAHTLASLALQRAEASGHFRWKATPTDRVFNPGFFRGASGVGFTLLRLAFPDELPCALLLE